MSVICWAARNWPADTLDSPTSPISPPAQLARVPARSSDQASFARTHDYTRHDATCLFAAFNIADGTPSTSCTAAPRPLCRQPVHRRLGRSATTRSADQPQR